MKKYIDTPDIIFRVNGESLLTERLRILENSDIFLTCEATAIPSVKTYEWFIDGIKQKHYQSSELAIHQVNRESAGKYTCRAINSIGSSESSKEITIICNYFNSLF